MRRIGFFLLSFAWAGPALAHDGERHVIGWTLGPIVTVVDAVPPDSVTDLSTDDPFMKVTGPPASFRCSISAWSASAFETIVRNLNIGK